MRRVGPGEKSVTTQEGPITVGWIVNENEGKRPEQYVIRDINPNFQNLSIAPKQTTDYGESSERLHMRVDEI